jgi:hypothetical protein
VKVAASVSSLGVYAVGLVLGFTTPTGRFRVSRTNLIRVIRYHKGLFVVLIVAINQEESRKINVRSLFLGI